MATVREGKQGVLVVVDVQVGVLRDAWDAERVIGNVARTVERARASGKPVLWVQHADDELARGSAEWQWVRELNIAMTWLSYPGRTNGTAGAEEVDFATPGGVRA